MKDILLKFDKICVAYDDLQILEDVTLQIDEGEMVAIMGPNGAGKSTVLKSIFGLTRILSGHVLWHDAPIHPVSHRLVEMGVSFVPQGRRVFTSLTVEENLEIGAFMVNDRGEVRRRMEEVMKTFPVLKEKRRAPSGTLSGGQQQMLAIARGLMTEPRLLLLDEPTLGLSPKLVKEVFQKIRDVHAQHHTAILIVEHNIKSLLEFIDRAYILDKGRVVAHGNPTQLIEAGTLEKVFMGRM